MGEAPTLTALTALPEILVGRKRDLYEVDLSVLSPAGSASSRFRKKSMARRPRQLTVPAGCPLGPRRCGNFIRRVALWEEGFLAAAASGHQLTSMLTFLSFPVPGGEGPHGSGSGSWCGPVEGVGDLTTG